MAEPETFLTMLYGGGHPAVGLLKPVSPLFGQLIKRRFRIRPETIEASREKVRAAFDKVEAEVRPGGYLAGDTFTVADLTAASILALIVMPPEFPYFKLQADERTPESQRFRDSLKGHRAFAWVEDMYARHRGTSAETPR